MSARRLTQYEFSVGLDSWSIVHLIMPLIIEDPHDWVNCVLKRTEVPSEALGVVSPSRYAFNRRLCLYLRSTDLTSEHDFISHFHDNWMTDSSSIDQRHVMSECFRFPEYYLNGAVLPHHFLAGVYIWYKFLNQHHFRPYWDEVEGVGVSVLRDFFPPLDLSRLHGFSVHLPVDVRSTNPPKLIRDSRTADLYLGGPVSLVNHACSKHSNCILNLTDGVRLAADTFVKSGDRIYICYNESEDELLQIRGFSCAVCNRYFVLSC